MDLNRNTKISIGMPVYNGALFIRDALDSILSQTYTDFELIISDNCSDDDTEKICRNYAAIDRRIRYIRHDKNRGSLFNFNFVLHEAGSEYFMWAACDDKWSINWLDSLYNELSQLETKNRACFGRVVQIDDASRILKNHPATKNKFDFRSESTIRKIKFYISFEGDGKANLFYSLFRKTELEKFKVIEYSKDYYTIFDMLNTLSFHSVDDAFLYKRIHNSGGGCEVPLSFGSKLIKFITLQSIIDSVVDALGYIRYANGVCMLLVFFLMPFKVIYTHLRYFDRFIRRFK